MDKRKALGRGLSALIPSLPSAPAALGEPAAGGEGESDVAALTATTGSSRTSISQHLAKLRFAGLVATRREGRHVIYRLVDGHLSRLVREGLNYADHHVTGEPHHF